MKKFAFSFAALSACLRLIQAQPAVNTQPADQVVSNGSSVSLSVTVSGTGPFNYRWFFNGTRIASNVITTVAGKAGAGFSGDGGAATNANLNLPGGVSVDLAGNLYVGEWNNHRIRKVDTNGMITTVVGNGNATYAGDGGPATNASLNNPQGALSDADGNLFVVDTGNNRIRKVDTNGIITTVAGNGNSSYFGDGGPATNASLSNPAGIAFDLNGNLYIADLFNERIRRVDTNGIITTVVGTDGTTYSGDGGAATNANLYHPSGVQFDSFGNLYISDTAHYSIRKVDTNGIITTVTGNGTPGNSGDGGAATNARVSLPSGLAIDGVNKLYIADYGNNRVRLIETNGIITTVAGNGSAAFSGDNAEAFSAGLNGPQRVAVDGVGDLYIADRSNNRIRKVHFTGDPVLTMLNASPANAGDYFVIVASPSGSVTSAVAKVTIAAPPVVTLQPQSAKVTAGTSPVLSVGVIGSGPFAYSWFRDSGTLIQSGVLNSLTLQSVTTNDAGNYFAVVSNVFGSVTSQVAKIIVGIPPTVTIQPTNVSVVIGASITFNAVVQGTGPFRYQWRQNGSNLPNNIITTVAGNGVGAPNGGAFAGDGGLATNASLYFPQGVGLDPSGNLFIADNNNNRVRMVDSNAIIKTVAGKGTGTFGGDGGLATNASLSRPNNIAFDAASNMFIADIFNHRIRKVDSSGVITTVAGNGGQGFGQDGVKATNTSLYYPASVSFDSVGNFYIADLNNARIRKVGTNGFISTVVGNGVKQFAGDGGAATNASLNYPQGATMDGTGNLFVADTANHRVRKVDSNGIITTIAGNGLASFAGDGGMATNGSLNAPWFVAVDDFGNVYIADRGNNRVRCLATNGIITTVAGNGSATYAGDGSEASSASLNGPASVALDAAGNLYIAEWFNNRIREVHFAAPTITRAHLGTDQAGNYSVVVSSLYGSVTSSVVALTVIVPPSISSSLSLNGAIQLTWSTQPNLTYQLECATNLVTSGWQSIGSPITATNAGTFSYSDVIGNEPQRFYRVRLIQ